MVTVSGLIDPIARTPILAPASGLVETLRCELGAKAEKGEICATLDPRPFDEARAREKAALAAAEEQLAARVKARVRAQAAVEKRETRPRRAADGRKTIGASRRALVRAQTQFDRAEAAVAQRRDALARAEAARTGAEIAASVDGFIVEQLAVVGERVAAGAPVFVIGDATTIRLRAKASGDGIFAITPGAEAIVTSEATPERAFPGKVIEVRRPATPLEGATVDIVIEAENFDLALLPGMEASARIEINEGGAALRTPHTALRNGERRPARTRTGNSTGG